MVVELEKSDWKRFFDDLSHEMDNWETTIHVLSGDRGAQVLSDRLPFHGLTIEDVGGLEAIGLLYGFGPSAHKKHSIFKPTKVVFAERGRGPAGTLDIEDATGTTTLITFIQPHNEIMQRAPTDLATS